MRLPRFLTNCFTGYVIKDFKEFLKDGSIEVHLERDSESKDWKCFRCGNPLGARRGKYPMTLEGMPIMGMKLIIHFWRFKGECAHCKKARAEAVEFICTHTPHLTEDYGWWLGRLCEIAPVSRVAELVGQDETTTWRLDLARMRFMLQHYKIPKVTRIAVDEVYARKKPKFKGESRDARFFTIVSDLDTHRVIWVSEGRTKASLDEFFNLIGNEACKRIEVVAADQHDDYAVSVREHCKKAVLVWDRFHIMKNFEEAVNETRKDLHGEQATGSELHRLTRGGFRFLFVKKASRRTPEEQSHIDDVLKANEYFAKLEIIKERMLSFFNAPDEASAKEIFDQVGEWAWQSGFKPLMKWHKNLEGGWNTLKNYFRYRVTSALAEGQNNAIKMLKRRGYGYRNMDYFKLKIMQLCGYLNSRFISSPDQVHAQI